MDPPLPNLNPLQENSRLLLSRVEIYFFLLLNFCLRGEREKRERERERVERERERVEREGRETWLLPFEIVYQKFYPLKKVILLSFFSVLLFPSSLNIPHNRSSPLLSLLSLLSSLFKSLLFLNLKPFHKSDKKYPKK